MPVSAFSPFIETLGIWVAVFLTLAVFSFLYRDNPIYKVAEHLYVGIAAGYYFYQAFRATIYPNLFQHAIEGAQQIGTSPAAWQTQWRWGAMVLGILILSRLVPKYSWLSRWPMALVVGAFAGLNLVGYAQANLVDQINGTFVPLVGQLPGTGGTLSFWPSQEPAAASTFNYFVLVTGVVSVLVYFLFSSASRGHFTYLQLLGMGFIMVTFGATYGSIVLARVSLLIGRVQMLALVNRSDIGYPPIVCAIAIIAALVFWRIRYFKPEDQPEIEP
jgi:hypothetical protein